MWRGSAATRIRAVSDANAKYSRQSPCQCSVRNSRFEATNVIQLMPVIRCRHWKKGSRNGCRENSGWRAIDQLRWWTHGLCNWWDSTPVDLGFRSIPAVKGPSHSGSALQASAHASGLVRCLGQQSTKHRYQKVPSCGLCIEKLHTLCMHIKILRTTRRHGS